MLQKIVSDDMRSMQIKAERENLLVTRGLMRKQADLQKQNMVEAFEKMKLKGKVDVSDALVLVFRRVRSARS